MKKSIKESTVLMVCLMCINCRHVCEGFIDKRWSECMRHGRGAGAEYFCLKLRKLKIMVRIYLIT
jgi:hypothetical protein